MPPHLPFPPWENQTKARVAKYLNTIQEKKPTSTHTQSFPCFLHINNVVCNNNNNFLHQSKVILPLVSFQENAPNRLSKEFFQKRKKAGSNIFRTINNKIQ